MPKPPPRIAHAWLYSLSAGVADFDRNWKKGAAPRLVLAPDDIPLTSVEPAPALAAARAYRYYVTPEGEFVFVASLRHGIETDPEHDRVYVAGDFNGWQDAVGKPEWQLHRAELEGEPVLMWRGPPEKIFQADPARFKFVTGEHLWVRVPNDALNAVVDDHGNINRLADPNRTGRHLWRFQVEKPLDLSQSFTLASQDEPGAAPVMVWFGDFFHELKTDLPLGARLADGLTHFALFAPRARRVTVYYCQDLAAQDKALSQALVRRSDREGTQGLWELTVNRDLRGWFYWYMLDGAHGELGGFDPTVRVLDPYALATVGPAGPGIILDPKWIESGQPGFATPPWQDLVIVEAHVRDLSANAPVAMGAVERRGFTGLRRWVESPEFYLHELGVNCVELQPVQQTDNTVAENYSWGYMTTNFFAPESTYSLVPAAASGVRELQDLVAAFHRRGMAVLLDVVFNHVGQPAHLMAIDRLYYFEQDPTGRLSNWSGCGNDLRARAAMAKRLIIDACVHLIKVYYVDGFRFDLAELLGVDVLKEVEAALKQVKPDVVLIAEPWSFRGHIAGVLRDTGWASWNDGYRDFIRDYVLGRGSAERLEYFLRGSPWYFAKWPSQTVNYTQSHDDRSWIDTITENPGNNGFVPTANDRHRTHLMVAALCISLGIPMLASGQDLLWSKRGESNTFQRGDLNALNYRRMFRFPATHAYFADWIKFRRGPYGRFVRQFSRPSEGFYQFFRGAEGTALAVVLNADGSQGRERLLFAINPLANDILVPIGAAVVALGPWKQLADHELFYPLPGRSACWPVEAEFFLPGESCGLWLASGEG